MLDRDGYWLLGVRWSELAVIPDSFPLHPELGLEI